MTRYLVTGGAGYIGSHLVDLLLNRGQQVIVLDKGLYGFQALEEFRLNPLFDLQVGDVRIREDVEKALEGVTCVIHLAGLVGNPACSWNKEVAWSHNVGSTRVLLDCLKCTEVKKFVFASSCSVYGYGRNCFTEMSSLNPVDYYAQTKMQSEQDISEASLECSVAILRFSTVFGVSKRMRFDLAVNGMTRDALCQGVLHVYGGSQERPFISCRDIGAAILGVVSHMSNNSSIDIYNIGNSAFNYTLKEIGELITKSVHGADIILDEKTVDKRSYKVSFDKINNIGFEPSVSVTDGVTAMIQTIKNHLFSNPYSGIYSNYEMAKQLYLNGDDNE